MLEGVLNFSYSDLCEIDVEYGIDIEIYLKQETTEVIKIKPRKSIELIPVQRKEQMPKGFAVLCYNVGCIFSKDYCTVEYELFLGDRAEANTILSREEAAALVRVHNLDLVINSRDGKAWE